MSTSDGAEGRSGSRCRPEDTNDVFSLFALLSLCLSLGTPFSLHVFLGGVSADLGWRAVPFSAAPLRCVPCAASAALPRSGRARSPPLVVVGLLSCLSDLSENLGNNRERGGVDAGYRPDGRRVPYNVHLQLLVVEW